MDLAALEAQLLEAAQSGDQKLQMRLYQQVGEFHLAHQRIDEGCFFLTNAWVMAVALGHTSEDSLYHTLEHHGRVPATKR